MGATESLTLGVMPLTDAVPLIVAAEKGFFEAENLNVSLVKEASWATIRDKVMFRAFDAAQMPAPMPLAMSFGLGHRPRPTIVPLVLSLNGNGVTVSEALIEAIAAIAPESLATRPIRADGVAAVARKRRAEGAAPLRFAVVFRYSTHQVQLRAWLEEAGVNPDVDIELLVVPPSQMAAELEAGRLDGYCVGEPWNQLAVRAGLGRLLITSYEIWPHRAEKVLGLAESVAEQRPEALQALLRALIRTGHWLERADHRLEAAQILVEGGWVRAPIEVVGLSLMGVVADGLGDEPRSIPEMHLFARHQANVPWIGHAELYAQAMVHNGQLARMPGRWELAQIFRPDLYRPAASAMGRPLPPDDIGPAMEETIFTRRRDNLSSVGTA